MKPILEVDRVSYSWPQGSPVLQQCSLQIPRPGLWMLVGGNGSGKSTLSNILLDQPNVFKIGNNISGCTKGIWICK